MIIIRVIKMSFTTQNSKSKSSADEEAFLLQMNSRSIKTNKISKTNKSSKPPIIESDIDAEELLLRDLQTKNSQEKYVSVLKGKILDVVIDLRKNSKSFGKHIKIILSETNAKSILIPSGCAHGFLGLDKENIVLYSNNNYRKKNNEVGLIWNDKNLKIKWPKKKLIISKKDKNNLSLKDFCLKYKI